MGQIVPKSFIYIHGMKTDTILDLVYQQFFNTHKGSNERNIVFARYAKEDLQLDVAEAKKFTLPTPAQATSWLTADNQAWYQFLNWYNYNYLLTNLQENPVGYLLRTTVRREYRQALKAIGKETAGAKLYRKKKENRNKQQ